MKIASQVACLAVLCFSIAGCNGQPSSSPPVLDSGITSSNGGGQRALGDEPNVGVTNGRAADTLQPRAPRVPRY